MLNKSVKKETIKNKDGNIIEIRKYNESGYPIYYKDIELKSEQWYEYDENDNMISYERSDEFKEWWIYDKNNNLIYHKSDNCIGISEEWYTYDENNNKIAYENSDGAKYLSKYEYYED